MGRDALYRDGKLVLDSFNPRARMGRDPVSKLKSRLKFRFQSTRPHGARLRSKQIRCISSCFNPRARMGRDNAFRIERIYHAVSIHAPAWGATIIRILL